MSLRSSTNDRKKIKIWFPLINANKHIKHPTGLISLFLSFIRMVSVSKDGTWKLWNTNVEYKKQQDPYLLKTVPCASSEGSRVALSPDGRVVAVSDGCNVAMYNATSGELEEELPAVHSEEITDLRFDINGRFLVTSGDKAIRVFHNAPGYRASIRDMQDMLKKAANEGMKQRLQQQIKEAQSTLDAVLASHVE